MNRCRWKNINGLVCRIYWSTGEENKRNAYWRCHMLIKRRKVDSFHGYSAGPCGNKPHDICYARSFDNGVTWYKTSGERYELPIKLSNTAGMPVVYLKENCGWLIRRGMSADAGGNPYIATYWREPDEWCSSIPHRLEWREDVASTAITDRQTPLPWKVEVRKWSIARPHVLW